MKSEIRKTFVTILLNLFFSSAFAQEWTPLTKAERDTSLAHNLKYETDKPEDLLVYRGFVVNFNHEKKTPNFTIHEICPKQLRKDMGAKVKRADRFKPDTYSVPADEQAVEDDYRNSGFDKGHFVPAADFYWDQVRKNETFFLTNIAPQTPDLNQVLWEKIESKIRNIVTDSSVNCYVITGAIYAAKRQRGMSDDKVGIPSSFYKIVYFHKNKKDYLNCFLVTHQFAYSSLDLSDYQISLNKLEKLTGNSFFEKLQNQLKQRIANKANTLFLQ
jgi:endonuclease G